MKFLPLAGLLLLGLTSCTTLENRRDLYNPTEDTGPYHSLQEKPPAATSSNPSSPEGPLLPSR